MLQLEKHTKGNIEINNKLLNKHQNVKQIFEKEKNRVKKKIYLNNQLNELNIINLKNLKVEEVKLLAYNIFEKYHKYNVFINDNNKILVSKTGIYESVEKIFNNYTQRELLKEHLKVFSNLGKIIEHAILVNQVYERKGRIKYNSWHYYIDGIVINNKDYLLEFEVVSMNNGENHYRIQRLIEK